MPSPFRREDPEFRKAAGGKSFLRWWRQPDGGIETGIARPIDQGSLLRLQRDFCKRIEFIAGIVVSPLKQLRDMMIVRRGCICEENPGFKIFDTAKPEDQIPNPPGDGAAGNHDSDAKTRLAGFQRMRPSQIEQEGSGIEREDAPRLIRLHRHENRSCGTTGGIGWAAVPGVATATSDRPHRSYRQAGIRHGSVVNSGRTLNHHS